MIKSNIDYNKADVLIVGAGPAGLAAAISIKGQNPDLDVCVIDKAHEAGGHNLSGAVMEIGPLNDLLDPIVPDWRDSDLAKEVLGRKVEKDDVLFLMGKSAKMSMMPFIKTGRLMGLGFGQMIHHGDQIVSISALTRLLADIAKKLGVEIMFGFAADDILIDESGTATGIELAAQGYDKEMNQQQNFVPKETVFADMIILAEGCDGLLTEKFVKKTAMKREANQLFSVCVKELIEVSDEQYRKFGNNRVVHAMGYPIWTPVFGPDMFGGGIMYAFGNNQIAVGMIVGADWKYKDFNPQDALVRFKEHEFVKQFIEGGTVVEAGAKMIPEGGYYAIPRDSESDAIGKNNVCILGDSAGFVNMSKIKGLHNAIHSGLLAGKAVAQTFLKPEQLAGKYTQLFNDSSLKKEMYGARKFRQTVAKFGGTLGFPLSSFGGLMPKFDIERDYEAMDQNASYKLRCDANFDKDAFTAVARVEHREEQPCHCQVLDESICESQCAEKYGRPCITFCPAGVYELINDQMKPANPSNCLHCKTCQNKCPYDNLRWGVPEGSGGPRYKNM